MITLKGTHISLRALEPEDIDFLYDTENNIEFWEVSNTQKPFSRDLLKKYLENAHLDLYEAKQLRLIIEEKKTKTRVGMIDIYDYQPHHHRAGLGILVLPEFQGRGYASEAIKITSEYAFNNLNISNLYAFISTDNKASISLFKKQGFDKSGTLKRWLKTPNTYKDVFVFQLLKHN